MLLPSEGVKLGQRYPVSPTVYGSYRQASGGFSPKSSVQWVHQPIVSFSRPKARVRVV